MAEVVPERRTVHAVLATPAGCDAAVARAGSDVVACRVSPGEAMLVGSGSIAALETAVRATDPDALVTDTSDGWTAFVIAGPRAREAFARLSELDLPDEGFVAGEVARIGARVLSSPDRIELFAPAMLADHLHARILEDCAGVLR